MTIVYSRNFTHASITVSMPPLLWQDDLFEQRWRDVLAQIAEDYAGRFFRAALAGYADLDNATYDWKLIQKVRKTRPHMSAGVSTVNPIFRFVEWNTKPHWPPYKKGSRLARWAGRKGLSPYYVASLIAMRGTTGRLKMTETLQEEAVNFRADVMAAFYRTLISKV